MLKHLSLILFFVQFIHSQNINLKSHIISSGIVENVSLRATIGQPFAFKTHSNGIVIKSGFWGLSNVTSLGNDNILPIDFEISNAYPNPFNPTTNIDFSIPKKGNLNIEIYDISGSLIFSYQKQINSSGKYKFTWNAINELNRGISSGIYMAVVNINDITKTQKITYLK